MESLKEQKEHYYTYFADGSESWHIKTPPPRNRAFEKELEILGGLNPFRKPVLRVVWAGRHLSDISAVETLKYKQIWKGKEFFYLKDGKEIRITHTNHAPDGVVIQCREVIRELGRLRWTIEKWQSIEEALRAGRFSDERDEKGDRIWKEPPPEGCYNHWWRIETADGQFRDLDDEVLETAKQMWRYQQNTPILQQMKDFEADNRREQRQAEAEAEARWNGLVTPEERELITETVARQRELLIETQARKNRTIFT